MLTLVEMASILPDYMTTDFSNSPDYVRCGVFYYCHGEGWYIDPDGADYDLIEAEEYAKIDYQVFINARYHFLIGPASFFDGDDEDDNKVDYRVGEEAPEEVELVPTRDTGLTMTTRGRVILNSPVAKRTRSKAASDRVPRPCF